MAGLDDWIEIVAPAAHNEDSMTLSPSEVARLAHDLRQAHLLIAHLQEMVSKQDEMLDRAIKVAENYRELYEQLSAATRKAVDLAQGLRASEVTP